MHAEMVKASVSGVVRDIMQHDVVTIAPEATVHELAELLLEKEISGVPVIGANGLVAGVVSLWDVVRLAAEEGARPELVWVAESPPVTGPGGFYGRLETGRPSRAPLLKTIRPPLLQRHTVREIMTQAAFHVHADTTITDLAGYLARTKIHRALVLDEGRLLGIVTATDVLEAVAAQASTR